MARRLLGRLDNLAAFLKSRGTKYEDHTPKDSLTDSSLN